MSARLKRYQFDRAVQAAQDAHKEALEALDAVAEAEMAELAMRFPKRRLELHSGMGSTSLTITKRDPSSIHDEWSWGPDADANSYHQWPDGVELPAKGLWAAIHAYQDTIGDGRDPGFGVIIYDAGKRIKGLS